MRMEKLLRRLLALLLTALLLTGVFGIVEPARADSALVLTLGADLTDAQKQGILDFFNVKETDAMVIVVTNADEHKLLDGQYTQAQIGTKTLSCALVNPTASGGIQVKTANMNVVTSGRIASILSTSGITDCEVLAAAPFMVSGTGALTGVMMGYEQAMGVSLDPEKQQMAIEESTTVSQIGETIGQEEATLVVNDIKIRIVRDKASKEEEIQNAVNVTLEQVEGELAKLAQATGRPAPEKLGEEDRETLYTYGRKISAMNYDYDSMKVTLQRVTVNAAREIGIDDPITETFEDLSAEDKLPDNSILRTTNDESMGESANITATDSSTLEDAPTLDDAVATAEMHGHLYALFDISMNWTDARRYCRGLGGDLASVSTLEEQQLIQGLAAQSAKNYSWLGGRYEPDYDRWFWCDGDSFRFSNWDDGQPDGRSDSEFFLRMANRDISYTDWMSHAGKWNDAKENGDSLIPVEDFGFICELEQARGQAEAVARETASTARVTGLRLTPIGSVEGAEQILSGTSLLVMEKEDGRGLADLTGKVLTDRTYKYFFGLDHGLIEAEIAGDENLGKNGVLDQGGHLVVPCTYNDIKILSPRWVIGIALTGATEADYDYTGYSGDTKKYYQIAAADVYYVRDGQGNLLKTLSRQEYESAEALDDYINIRDRSGTGTTYDSGFNVVARDVSYGFEHVKAPEYSYFLDYDAEHHYGIQDANGNVVLPPSMDYVINIANGCVEYGMRNSDGTDLRGLMTLDGTTLLPCAFEHIYLSTGDDPVDAEGNPIYRWNHMGYYCVRQDGVFRFAVDGGAISNDTGIAYDEPGAIGAQLALRTKDDDDRFTLYAADGQVTGLDGIYSSCYSAGHAMGLLWKATNSETYNYDLLDWHGNVLLSNQSSITLSGDGMYLAAREGYDSPMTIYAVTYTFDDGQEISAPGVEPAPQADATSQADATPQADAPQEVSETKNDENADLIATLEKTITTIQQTDFEAARDQIAQILDKEMDYLARVDVEAAELLGKAAEQVRSGAADADTTIEYIQSAIEKLR